MGVIFDVETMVERVARRVLCPDGWKWQIVNAFNLSEYDYCVEVDQEILDEIGKDLSLVEVI